MERIVSSVSERPKSVKELSEELDVGWKTCVRYLRSLKNIGVVVEIKTKKESLFAYHQLRRPKLLTVPRVRVGITFDLTEEKPPRLEEVEDLT